MTHPVENLLDLLTRADAASNDPPLLYASDEIVDKWVLVPRAHLRMIQSWGDQIDDISAINMITEILADARLIGRKDQPDVDVRGDTRSGS